MLFFYWGEFMVVAEQVRIEHKSIADKFDLSAGVANDVRCLEAQFKYFKGLDKNDAMCGVVTEIAAYLPASARYSDVADFYFKN